MNCKNNKLYHGRMLALKLAAFHALQLFRAPYGRPYDRQKWDNETKAVSDVVARDHVYVGW